MINNDLNNLIKSYQDGNDTSNEIWAHSDLQKFKDSSIGWIRKKFRLSTQEAIGIVWSATARALKTFEPQKGVAFTTHARNWVQDQIYSYLNENRTFSRINTSRQIALNLLKELRHKDPDITYEEIAEIYSQRTKYNKLTPKFLQSVDLFYNQEYVDCTDFGDLCGTTMPEIEDVFSIYEDLYNAMEKLSINESTALIYRFGLFGEEVRKFSEISELSGYSGQYAHQLKDNGLKKLKKFMKK